MSSFSTDYYLLREGFDSEGNENGYEVEIRGYITEGDPGRYCGKPEDCYPAEPDEIEITSVTLDGDPFEVTTDEITEIGDWCLNHVHLLDHDDEEC